MKVAILQSNYIPWKGYFDLIASVDRFVVYDDAQYTCRDWRNRNQIKTPQGLLWLTVPVRGTGRYCQSIRDVEILPNSAWAEKHWKSLALNYAKAAHFDAIARWLQPLYVATRATHLSPLNHAFLTAVCANLSIDTPLISSDRFQLPEGRTERLVAICRELGATEYVSGPRAARYIKTELFDAAGIKLTYFNYDGYREYPQLWGPFTHTVSIVDVLFNCGSNARDFIRRT